MSIELHEIIGGAIANKLGADPDIDIVYEKHTEWGVDEINIDDAYWLRVDYHGVKIVIDLERLREIIKKNK